ncbi:matrixin family metalloprotease [Streptomyces luteocolor]|uniref:matrixin family metalloprotease n=1 Tax=Streptomyces luteocolor TaxID=285500 RepID=UPI00114D0431|nr:matrixin family metalloprotease [Streptomyces luteocolor]
MSQRLVGQLSVAAPGTLQAIRSMIDESNGILMRFCPATLPTRARPRSTAAGRRTLRLPAFCLGPRSALLAASMLALSLVTAPPVTAKAAAPAKCMGGMQDSRGRSSVDGGEIAWEDESRFDDARRHAHRAWSQNGLDRVKFPADDASRIADLEWSDVNTTRSPWTDVLGYWKGQRGTDTLRLNRAYLGPGKRYGDTASRRMVAAHELGHALGFCHKNPQAYRSLMAPQAFDMPSNGKPTYRDRKNYHALWG